MPLLAHIVNFTPDGQSRWNNLFHEIPMGF
jgi:hypothetical protein